VSAAPGRALGVDLGDARIGVALSDPLGVTAQPLGAVPARGPRQDLRAIASLVREHEVGVVVVGLPLLMSGGEGERAVAARAFAEGLGRRVGGVRVELWDERLTTAEAERTLIAGGVRRGKRKKAVDAMAAALILQGWLDARSRSAP